MFDLRCTDYGEQAEQAADDAIEAADQAQRAAEIAREDFEEFDLEAKRETSEKLKKHFLKTKFWFSARCKKKFRTTTLHNPNL